MRWNDSLQAQMLKRSDIEDHVRDMSGRRKKGCGKERERAPMSEFQGTC